MQGIGERKAAPGALALLLTLACMFLCGAVTLLAQSAAKQVAVPLPPMGWSSWNSFSNTVDSPIVMDQAKAMISTGMVGAGYEYINIDEGWWLGERDTEGNIVVDAKAWPAIAPGEKPGDMANIVRYIHGLGLKAGIYTDAGKDGCGTVAPDLGPGYPNEGSEGHYEQDFLQFAKWGFDYVKVDWCGGDKENLDPAIQYAEIARTIARAESITGRRLYFSICNWGKNSPWTWAAGVGGVTADIWRTGGDNVAPIVANTKNANRRAELKEVFREFDEANHPEAQHTGFYNDPDMMVVGMPGLTDDQNRVHMSLWAMSGGPLLVGADLTKLSEATIATLTKSEVIAIDQDALGLQAVKVTEAGKGREVWSKPLSKPGERAVLLLNRTAEAAPISVTRADLTLLDSSAANVTDLWRGKGLGPLAASYSVTVPANDALLLLVQGKEAKVSSYKPAIKRPGRSVIFTHVSATHSMARVQIVYTNPGKVTRIAELRVNGRIATRIALPATGTTVGTVTIQSLLDRSAATNVLEFSTPSVPGPVIQSISVQ
jgi:Alpha galactosidase A/Alpha galactosidase C-terminal beta sandwich domain